ncbi:MAG: WYL domain-containing protein [Clostridium sp.]|nr:WYL domain-containing protein [Clostridium sp.]
MLKERCGEDCVETDGNNRGKRFRYVGKEDDPCEDLKNAQAIKDIQTYAQFCIDSAGFFPSSWIEYFFEDTLDLLKITKRKKSGEQLIASSIDRELKNIEHLPMLYEAIKNKRVLVVEYKPYDEDSISLVFHPHILKEHNGRWFLFGHAEGKEPEWGYNLAIDRIVDEPQLLPVKTEYISSPKGFYQGFFKDIVGVSHFKYSVAEDIIFRATKHSIYRLVETKRIHQSQEIIKPFSDYEDGTYGEFRVRVELNNEFIGRILQMGDGLVVVAPENIRQIFKHRLSNMADLYH